MGHAFFDCERLWHFWLDSPSASLCHQVRTSRFNVILHMTHGKFNKKEFELFTYCLWLAWYVRNVMATDELEIEARTFAPLCFAWANGYLEHFRVDNLISKRENFGAPTATVSGFHTGGRGSSLAVARSLVR